MYQPINILSSGGAGDFILSKRLSFLLNQVYLNKYLITNFFCSRNETFKIIETLYPEEIKNGSIQSLSENFLDSIKNQEDLDKFYPGALNLIIYPDKLFRGLGKPPFKEWGISNFTVKQTRTLLGKWKPENYISLALNSITDGYTYHSIKELALELCQEFPDKIIYLPILSKWNGKDLPTYNFNNHPKNLLIDYSPNFARVYDILCKSEYCVCTDNAMMHICHDLNLPYLTLDPRYNQPAFESRWRPDSYYHSIPINSLVEDIVNVVKIQLEIPETQMIGVNNTFRQDRVWKNELIFKE